MPELTTQKLCVVTGSRADWGLLKPVMKKLQEEKSIRLQLVVTGTHLEKDYGYTLDTIRHDGFIADITVPVQVDTLSPRRVTDTLARTSSGLARAFEKLEPDIILILGDRYEILAAAEAALIARIPVAHIAGGDITEGAFDDAIRHAITKMSHLHFTTHQDAYERVIQMGENPRQVFLTGSPAIDDIINQPLLNRQQLEDSLDIHLPERFFLFTWHAETLDDKQQQTVLDELAKAIRQMSTSSGWIITGTNADTDGQVINDYFRQLAQQHEAIHFFMHLGQQRYYSLMEMAMAVVGNSSSGLYEAPSFRTPTVNIGERQSGRLQADSVFNCKPESGAIIETIHQALSTPLETVENPYGDGHASERIVNILKQKRDKNSLLHKHFHKVAP